MPKDILKVVLIGDGGVGKTSLRNQFIQKRFTSAYKATIGADFITKEVIRDDGRPVMLQIWDTAGQERFQSLGVAFYRGADACVLVYDVNNYPTFQHLERWHAEFLAQAGIPSSHATEFPFLIIGNKIDVDDRVVSRRQARALAQQLSRRAAEFAGAAMGVEMQCFEASAKEGTGVEEAFSHIARIAKTPQMELDLTGVDRTRLRRSDSTGAFSVRSRLERRKAEANGGKSCCW